MSQVYSMFSYPELTVSEVKEEEREGDSARRTPERSGPRSKIYALSLRTLRLNPSNRESFQGTCSSPSLFLSNSLSLVLTTETLVTKRSYRSRLPNSTRKVRPRGSGTLATPTTCSSGGIVRARV